MKTYLLLTTMSAILENLPKMPLANGDIDFTPLAIFLGAISLGGVGVIIAGMIFWQETAQRYKRMIPEIIFGIVLTMVAAGIVEAIGG
ncbi:MAG: hypothetical protein HN413_13355 [Chloroflexi bacterium]|jgi:hypothetical protein|nr:hypothetical protein [Chloroflexota bacterium]